MDEYPTLKNAPITEALLDIQVVLPPEVDLVTLAGMQDELRDRFPIRQERALFEFQLAAKEGAEPEVSKSGGVQGYSFLSSETKPTKVVQARLNGFTFSKLRPYQSWALFRDEAQELWHYYINIAHPIRVTRLGLRNINRIELPLPLDDFSRYFLTKPDIAPGIPPAISDFFLRLVMPEVGSGAVAIVTMAVESLSASDTILPVIFDIDVFMENDYDPDSEAIWHTFEDLRRIKNNIFFSSITKETEGLFR